MTKYGDKIRQGRFNTWVKRVEAQLAMVLVAMLWGMSFPLIRTALQSVDPVSLVTVRFLAAGIVFVPLVFFSASLRKNLKAIWLGGLGIGALNFIIFLTQTLGLETTTGPRAAFITGSYVIFVPMMSRFFGRPSPSLADWSAAGISLCGLFLLADPLSSTGTFQISTGDLFVLVTALGCAVKIHSMTRIVLKGANPTALTCLQMWGVNLCCLLAWPFMPAAKVPNDWNLTAVLCILTCALGITVTTAYLQGHFQKYVAPQKTAVLFCLEPVFATLFSYLFISETLGPKGLMGGALILTAQLLPIIKSQSLRVRQSLRA